jgi:hypothetical protein
MSVLMKSWLCGLPRASLIAPSAIRLIINHVRRAA